ncbi:xaa-Pro aminopeptidase 2 [Gouania willdenowi]|uniref:Xaa-Pro aminopeptidase 2 n=1 Tax=Gouania willdenowi TaxID=441366 RepID=A0A8C5HAP0_GOUWI|nr:xaa-Pro aminopeptidase 2 [Gouania willdenowi]
MPSNGGWLLALSVAALTVNTIGAATSERTERNCSVTPPYLPSTAVNTTIRLQELREHMLPMNISAYIIPGTDAHLSEYIAPRDARVAFMTGFTGSAGSVVVTQTKASLWTDSRYWVQAERQMDCNWDLETDFSIGSVAEWLIAEVPPGGEIGFDPFLFSLKTHNDYSLNLEFSNRSLRSIPINLVDRVWKDRPSIRPDSLTRLPDRVIQRSWQIKVDDIRTQMKEDLYEPTALLLSALDESAWLFNMRGNDIPYNPFFYSYTLLTMDEIWLFVHMNRVTDDLKEYLNASCDGALCVQLKSYDSVLDHVKQYVATPGVKVWIGTEYTNYALYEIITPQDKLMTSTYSPVLMAKAVKDETEQRILRDAHIRDAVAVVQLLMWLEKVVPNGKETELSAAEYVNHARSKQKDNRGPSFETISASGPNAALAHYSPTNDTSRKLTVDEMYLVDSGGQYLDGTTDITRTVHWGNPTALQKEAFTRVLMGNIEISRTIFPTGTRGVNMEMLGRRALWELGLNYGHGTGHGVGNYFGVHEWPVGFQSNNIPFRAGMFTSIEPGFYKENDFGIRIEDVVVIVPVDTKYGHNYLTFDTVSLVPYDRKLIDTSLLSSEQLQWLNRYYETIRRLLVPELDSQGLHEEKKWVLTNTEPFIHSGSSATTTFSSSLTIFLLGITVLHNVIEAF